MLKFFYVVSLCSLFELAFSGDYKNLLRHDEYDYIIVGAGSTGAVIASRLSENPSNTVLLLEAGGLPANISDVPLLAYELSGTKMDWQYVTAPQEKACLAYRDKTNPMPRGKVLGGCSVINCMLYTRGNHDDYNDWEKQGAEGWSWDDVSYYFLKSEDQTNKTLLLDGYHKTGGPLTVSGNSYFTPIRNSILDAGASYGMKIVDYNGETQEGLGVLQSTIRNGHRWSTEKAFLSSTVDRSNLDIVYNAFVTRILFEDKTARNVTFDFQGSSRSVAATKEIVLSAGAIGSPQILMLSGIGPRKHLEELKIPLVADLPVGENLQDHIRESGLQYYFKERVGLVFSRDVNENSYKQFQSGKGPLTVPCGVEVTGFMKTKYQNGSDQRPDIQINFLSPVVYPDSNQNQLMKNGKLDVISVYPTLVRPASQGFIKLNSTNPYDHPIINPQYLNEEEDVLRIVEGWKATKALMDEEPIKKFNPELRRTRAAGCDTPDMDSDEYLKCNVRALTHTADHQAGTCKMGKASDATTVVDPLLRVKGIKNLRVADASIMPSVTTGNTNAPCIMIGEKAADLIQGRKWDPKQGKVVSF